MPKPKLNCLLLVCCLIIPLNCVSGQSIHEKGIQFLKSHCTNPLIFNASIRFSEKSLSSNQVILQADDPPCFIIFQMVRTDTLVVAYSSENIFCPTDTSHPAATEFLHQIGNTAVRKLLKTGNEGERLPVGPLLKTRWNQDDWFNRYCPFNIQCNAGQNAYAGCIAVALAQVIRYYGKWNNFIIDAEHNYQGSIISAYSKGYDWAGLIDIPVNYELEACRMLADIGVQCKINYGISSSSQSTGIARKGLNEMGFENAIKAEQNQYEGDDWIKMIYESIQNYSPVFVAGGGHAFVCDGYDKEGRLHFNLGWGGFADGYYNQNCVYGTYCATEAIFDLIPDNQFGRPHSLRIENIERHEALCWSPPDDWEDPIAYRIYYSDDEFFETADTCISVSSFKAGTWGIMVSAVYPEGESIWTGPQWIYNSGPVVFINDKALLNGLNGPCDDGVIIIASSMIPEGKLADKKILIIEGQVNNTDHFKEIYRLQELGLNSGNLKKEDLSFIESLKYLQTLRLTGLEDNNMPDLKKLPKLVELVLDSCQLSDLNFISDLDHLVALELNNCRIEDFILPPGLASLEILILNEIDGLPSSFSISELKNLRRLEIFNCNLAQIVLDNELEKLTCLAIENNKLEDYGFLQRIPNIMRVSLKSNELKRLDILAHYKHLKRIDLSDNKIDRLSVVYDIPSLTELDISNNCFEKFPGIFKHMPNLSKLDISFNKLKELPRMKLPYLKELNLAGNQLTHLSGIELNESVKTLNISRNRLSDFNPLLKNEYYKNLTRLDISINPISKESFYEVIPLLEDEINSFLAPEEYEPRSPCYPVPHPSARVSNNEINLAWYIEEGSERAKYDLYFGSGDSIRIIKDKLNYPATMLRLDEGQKYKWQVAAIYSDTAFYSGLYELRTTSELQLPYIESFELYPLGENITAASSNWRLSHGSSDSYQDAIISDKKAGEGHGKSLHIESVSNISLDLDHIINLGALVIEFEQFITNGKTAHVKFLNIQGLQLDLYSNGYTSQLFLDGDFELDFTVRPDNWNSFRVSIQGHNERITVSCNGNYIFNKKWEFTNSAALIESIVFSSDKPAGESPFTSVESYIDNLFIYDANNWTGVDEVLVDKGHISIYPNPADRFINISGLPVNKDFIFELHDSWGRKVFESNIINLLDEATIPVMHFDPGVYFYRLSGDNATICSGKLLIAR